MRNFKVIFLLVTLYILLSASFGYAQDIAVIVNKENATNNLSFKDLENIFKQEKQHWEGGKKIYLIMQEHASPEKKIVLKKIYKMTDKELKKFWLTKMFRGEIASFPKTLSSNRAVRRFVSLVPNAIGFIDASSVEEDVKVLRIEGKLPNEKGYLLSERSEGEE